LSADTLADFVVGYFVVTSLVAHAGVITVIGWGVRQFLYHYRNQK
jgi:hypothetical protein